MGSTTLISLDEYLHTTYRPDCDFLEGELEERNVGEAEHGLIQGLFWEIFRQHRNDWQVRVIPEWRVQVKAQRFRIPDVTVVPAAAPKERRATTPPLLCIEVMSTDDTLRSLRARIEDYFDMGVQHVWVVDPWQRVGYHATREDYLQPEDGYLRVDGTDIAVSLPDLFVAMDEA
jgi:Uma2 family endonuclease